MKTYGREVIYANYTEEELLSGTEEQIVNKIIDILNNSVNLHEKNRGEILYLQDYLYGDQDIKYKEKKTRIDINNKNVENWAYAFNDWKKTFLLGKPIKYAPLNDVSSDEITELNRFCTYEDKEWLDQEIYEDIFTCGRGFRYVFGSKVDENDETPFELLNLDVENTEVVYSSSINHEQLLSYITTSKKYITQYVDPKTGETRTVWSYYDEYNVYTRNKLYVINTKTGWYQLVDTKPLIFNTHIITEYYMNRKRMGFLEIVKDILDDINYIENLDLDDMEAFVNSIMVFTNAEVDGETMEAIQQYGAVSIKSTDQKKASVEILQSRLKSLDTQILYLRKLSAIHNILAVPQANNNGEVSNAETGKAMLTGQGFTSASIRIEGEEKSFKRCDREALKNIIKICKMSKDSIIKTLKVADIESKFNRDLSDNLLTKTQALINLATAKIPPEIRNQVIGLFADPVSVTKLQKQFEEEQRKLQQEIFERQKTESNTDEEKTNKDNNVNKINEQNNKISKAKENEKQGQ